MHDQTNQEFLQSASWYDATINWNARLAREIPYLREVFGEPGANILDAACGPGRHLAAMAEAGYCMTGLDRSIEMLSLARRRAATTNIDAHFIESAFEDIPTDAGPFDGIYCLGNSLASTADADVARRSIAALARALRPGGALVCQVLNFDMMRNETHKVRGPRVHREGETEYVSSRVYAFHDDMVEVTNITLWNDNGWQQHVHGGTLYAVSPDQLDSWLTEAGMTVTRQMGAYDGATFDPAASNDLIVTSIRS